MVAVDEVRLEWNARNAEHLLNRAAFGARVAQIQRGVDMGPEALIDQLFGGLGELPEPFFLEPLLPPSMEELQRMGEQARQQLRARHSQYEREQRGAFVFWWIEQMAFGHDPLRERMTLFWHGHFTSSMREVKSSRMMVDQLNFLRDNALGSFRTLVHGIVKNPAMLVYLNNNKNQRRSPNENLARELMELFTLGEGNYTEVDVKEAARALTGYQVRRAEFFFNKKEHDPREKTVLGVTGDLDADDLVNVLLAQEACPRWLATRLLEVPGRPHPAAGAGRGVRGQAARHRLRHRGFPPPSLPRPGVLLGRGGRQSHRRTGGLRGRDLPAPRRATAHPDAFRRRGAARTGIARATQRQGLGRRGGLDHHLQLPAARQRGRDAPRRGRLLRRARRRARGVPAGRRNRR